MFRLQLQVAIGVVISALLSSTRRMHVGVIDRISETLFQFSGADDRDGSNE